MSAALTLSLHNEIIPPLTPAQKSELHQHDTFVAKAGPAIKLARCWIAYHGWRIKKSGRWDEFGCSSEEEYYTSRHITAPTWDICMLVGRLLEPLPFDELVQIGIDKGRALSTVHPDLWHDYNWIADAKKMTERDFRDVITLRNRTLDGGEASEALLAAEAESEGVSRERVRRLQQKYQLDTPADAIAIALRDADTTVAIELAKAAKHASKLLTFAQQELRKRRKGALSSHTDSEVDRLIAKSKKRLYDAVACAVQVQSK